MHLLSHIYRCSFQVYRKNIIRNIMKPLSTSNDEIESMRITYDVSSISDELQKKNPIDLFQVWFQEAVQCPQIKEANAMTLATCSRDGYPTSRIVLFKGVSQQGFRFFTNYSSQKGRQLIENPRAAITFYWEPLQKQVRVCGDVQKLSVEESTEYFQKRPRPNQIGAIASRQSEVVPNRQYLENMNEELTKKYEGKDIPKPPHWGGFLIKPNTIEFWCGGAGRMHDRIRFRYPGDNETINDDLTKEGDNGWVYERLSP